jgi:hypothetical protein
MPNDLKPVERKFHFLEKHVSGDWMNKWESGLETFDWEPIPPRGRTNIYEVGAVLGPFLNLSDKRGGVEAGVLAYVRDEQYEEAVVRIVQRHIENDDPNSPIIQFFDKIVSSEDGWKNANNEKMERETIRQQVLALGNPVLPEQALKNMHLLLREFEKNVGKAIVAELENLSPENKLQKYLIKQDYKDPRWFNKVSYGARRTKMTARAKEIGAKYGSLAHKFVAQVHNIGKLQKKKNANKNGFMESLSTRLAAASGMKTQIQGIVQGRYEKPPRSKLLTLTKFEEGFSDFEGRLLGGTVKDGNFVVKMRYENGEMIGPERDLDGYFHVDNTINGLGENLVAVLRQDDYDFLGSKGGNKGIVKDEFFGIDFGHAYERDNQIVVTLKEDFSFKQPKGKPIKNVSVFYDNPLSEKMKGVLLLYKLRGKPVSREVLDSYERKYPGFLEKYEKLERNSDYLIFEQYQAKAAELEDQDPIGYRGLREEVSKRYKRAREADQLILNVFETRSALTAEQLDFVENMEKLCSETTLFSPHARIVNINNKRMQELEIEIRLFKALIPEELARRNIKIEDKPKILRKLIEKLENEYKKSAVVKLNHLRVNPASRVACQLSSQLNQAGEVDQYTISLTVPQGGNIQEVWNRIEAVDPSIKTQGLNLDGNIINISCSPDKLQPLMNLMTEDRIKSYKDSVSVNDARNLKEQSSQISIPIDQTPIKKAAQERMPLQGRTLIQERIPVKAQNNLQSPARLRKTTSTTFTRQFDEKSQVSHTNLLSTTKLNIFLTTKEVADINQRIKDQGINARFSMEANIPKFTGSNPIDALNACGNKQLQDLSYNLKIPDSYTEDSGVALAKEILKSKKSETKIINILISGKSYTLDEILKHSVESTLISSLGRDPKNK